MIDGELAGGRRRVLRPGRHGRRSPREVGPGGPTHCLVLALAVVVLAACQRPLPDDGADAALTQQVEGCWELAPAGDETERTTVRRWIEQGDLPGVVRLDTARAETGGDEEYRVAWSYVYSRRERRPLAAWRPVGTDSIRVETPGAMSGTVLRLSVAGEILEGTASVFSDVIGPGEEAGAREAPVEARRQDCPR